MAYKILEAEEKRMVNDPWGPMLACVHVFACPQFEQNMAYKILEAEEKRMFDEMNEQQALKAEQRHLEDKRRMKERRDEMVKVLDQQVRWGVASTSLKQSINYRQQKERWRRC